MTTDGLNPGPTEDSDQDMEENVSKMDERVISMYAQVSSMAGKVNKEYEILKTKQKCRKLKT